MPTPRRRVVPVQLSHGEQLQPDLAPPLQPDLRLPGPPERMPAVPQRNGGQAKAELPWRTVGAPVPPRVVKREDVTVEVEHQPAAVAAEVAAAWVWATGRQTDGWTRSLPFTAQPRR